MKRIYIAIFFVLMPFLAIASSDYNADSQSPLKNNLLIPSPVEMIIRGKALNVEVGSTTLKELFAHKYDKSNKVQSVIYLGRTMAVVSLGLEKMDDQTLGKYLLKIKQALIALDIPDSYLDQYEGLRIKYEQLQISKNDLMEELDMAFTSLGSRIGSSGDKNMMFHVLQGSAWVQAQNLLARSMKANKQYQFAKRLLHQPEITSFIIQNLKKIKDSNRSPDNIDSLIASVKKYQEATGKESLGSEELDTVIRETESFLSSY